MTREPQQDVCCLMGEPIAGNPTQYMLEKAFEAARLDWRFLTFEVPALDFEGALRGARIFGFHGIMLAPPHRSSVIPYLQEIGEAARISGQVNCIKQNEGRFSGYNTEGRALRQLLEQTGAVKGLRVTIVGAGRIARAIAAELAIVGAGEICFLCRRPEKIEQLTKTLVEQTPLTSCRAEELAADSLFAIDNAQVLINATPVGPNQPNEHLPLDFDGLEKHTIVADVAFNPPQTHLVKQAQACGCRTVDGLTLLIEQAALAFEIWTGANADRQAMREAVEEFLVL
ncbi:shikimate dehydrogenase family protein [Bythopirellula goksoeyrii]|nr:shikimate dehydrogenase [Bythopirellula goksoeyrii]